MRSASGLKLVILAAAFLGPTACGPTRSDSGRDATRTPAASVEGRPNPSTERPAGCSGLASAEELGRLLRAVPDLGDAGGLAGGRFEWAAIVDRQGEMCAVAVSTSDASGPWPGSQAIAKAKAFTANAFSTDTVPLSTARLYTLTQPGHSLWGGGAINAFNPQCLSTPQDYTRPGPRLCGGTVAFGGGVPLYRGSTRVGGLGASGDTACADHEIAKRIRDKMGLNPPGGPLADDITYSKEDGASVYTHPLCINTWRNGKKVGEEAAAVGY